MFERAIFFIHFVDCHCCHSNADFRISKWLSIVGCTQEDEEKRRLWQTFDNDDDDDECIILLDTFAKKKKTASSNSNKNGAKE